MKFVLSNGCTTVKTNCPQIAKKEAKKLPYVKVKKEDGTYVKKHNPYYKG